MFYCPLFHSFSYTATSNFLFLFRSSYLCITHRFVLNLISFLYMDFMSLEYLSNGCLYKKKNVGLYRFVISFIFLLCIAPHAQILGLVITHYFQVLSVICRDLRLLAAKVSWCFAFFSFSHLSLCVYYEFYAKQAERALSADRLSGRTASQRRNANAGGGEDFGGTSGGREDSFEKVADLLMNCFRVCASDTCALLL